ncbi:MAG: gamma-glutamyltransferase [Verrucomicrobiales bacterium]|nr:gamma-glutamyltransferase [Verrucomicrobiales bacterium]
MKNSTKKRQSRRSCRLLLVALLGLTSSCGTTRPGRNVQGSGSVPEGWAFPADQVAETIGRGGMVVTTDRVASEVGAEILRRGGNAVDAAVAVHFALAVVNPEAGNIGGGGFMILRLGNHSFALDFREKAPLAATRDMFLDESGAVTDRSRVGHLAAGVPGSVAGMWAAHQRFGTLPWAELLRPAINLAEGIVVHERLASSLKQNEDLLRTYPATRVALLPGGRAPRVGERLAQPDLAATLGRIAEEGMKGFYTGRTADLVVAEMERGGGLITREDLLRYEAVWREPILFEYRGATVVGMPPPSSGGVTLAELLNILEGYPLAQLGFQSGTHVHLWVEAARRAFADRNSCLGDPDFVQQPVATLISDSYAAGRRVGIDPVRATSSAEVTPGIEAAAPASGAEGGNTTHYSIVDGSGDAVAVTTTINSLYGSLVTVSGAGFLLNNEMDDFAASPGKPNQFGLVQGDQNAVEPGKRMLSSMCPTILLDSRGRVRLVTGSPGGPTIITSVAQLISNVLDFDLDLAAATGAPRWHHQHLPDVLFYERGGVRPEAASELRSMGHALEEREGYQGDTQSILVVGDGTLIGVSDPRAGGAAVSVRRVDEGLR